MYFGHSQFSPVSHSSAIACGNFDLRANSVVDDDVWDSYRLAVIVSAKRSNGVGQRCAKGAAERRSGPQPATPRSAAGCSGWSAPTSKPPKKDVDSFLANKTNQNQAITRGKLI